MAREEKKELEKVKDVKNMDLNHSNMLNQSEHDLRKSTQEGFFKVQSPEKLIRLEDGGDSFINELKNVSRKDKIRDSHMMFNKEIISHEDHFDVIDIIMKKFNSSNTSKTHKLG